MPYDEGLAAMVEDATAGRDVPFDITGKALKGWIMVPPKSLGEPDAVTAWVERGLAFAASLPAK